MLLEENLRSNRLFSENESEDRFRKSLQREILACERFTGNIREVIVGDSAPESAAAILASLFTKVPILLASQAWGQRTWGAFAKLREEKVPDGAVLIRTGGSSGEPKFAIHTWDSLQAAALQLWVHLGRVPLSSGMDLPLYHVSGLMPIFRAVVSGGLIECEYSATCGELPGMCLVSHVPTTLYRAIGDPHKLGLLQRADRVFAGGARFSPELLAAARNAHISLSLVYGMTETAGMIAMQEPSAFLAGEEPKVSAFQKNRITVDQSGEIWAESPQLFQGYLGQPRRTKSPWETGDLGKIDHQGNLSVLGRKGRFASSGGETVSLEKVEKAARSLYGVLDSYAAAIPDSEWGERVLLIVAAMEAGDRDWMKELKAILDPHEIPVKVQIRAEIPRNRLGKVDSDRLFS